MSDNHERTLQIGFGIVGVLSTVITLASLHHRDSLGCMLFRQLFLRRNDRTCMYNAIRSDDHLLNQAQLPTLRVCP